MASNNTTMLEFQSEAICPWNICPQHVLKYEVIQVNQQSNHDVLFLYYILVTFLTPIVVPTMLGVLSCHLWTVYNHSSSVVNNQKPLPPGSFGLPIIGETIQFLFGGTKFFEKKRKKYGNVFKTHILGKPTVRIIGAKNVKQILRGENSIVTSQWPTSTCMLLGNGCLSQASGESHMTRKRAIMRAFSYRSLSRYVPTMQTIVRKYIHKWCSEGNVRAFPELKLLTFDLSCQVLAGFEMDGKECARLMTVFETFIANIFSVPINAPGFGLRKGLQARQELLKKIGEQIEKKHHCRESGMADALGFIMNIDGDQKLSAGELRDICLELLFAGHGTTSSAATFIMFQLARNPEIVQKIKAEMKSNNLAINENGHAHDLDFDLVNRMCYTKNVVKEGLRLSPPIGAGFRTAAKTFEIDGYQIPEGWSVLYSIRGTHETTDIFNERDTFDPDRWSNLMVEDRFEYLPFGGGKRSCAGKEFALLFLKVFVIELVRNCSWTLVNAETEFKSFPVPYPVDSLPLEFSASSADSRSRARTV